jgi:hypothetical protein
MGNNFLNDSRGLNQASSLTFGQLLEWHLLRGTRPDGSSEGPGRKWTAKAFAEAVGCSDRTVRFWLRNEHLPPETETIERVLFGKNPAFAEWRLELRRTHAASWANRKVSGRPDTPEIEATTLAEVEAPGNSFERNHTPASNPLEDEPAPNPEPLRQIPADRGTAWEKAKRRLGWRQLSMVAAFGGVLAVGLLALWLRYGVSTTDRFIPIDLSGIANGSLDWLLRPPSSRSLDGIPFVILSGDNAVARTRNRDRADLPSAIHVPIGRSSIAYVHLLLNGNWVSGQQPVGSVLISYSDGSSREVELIPMQTIRETWIAKEAMFNASFLPPPAGVTWNVAFTESQARKGKDQPPIEAMAFLDRLSIATDPTSELADVTISNIDGRATTGIALTALTVEIAPR